MLTLYYKPMCPFSRQVVAAIQRLELEVDLKDCNDAAAAAELLEKGGKSQVPFLVDADQGVSMYESDDIVAHLQKHYGTPTATAPRVHGSDNVCIACEG